MLRPGDAVPHFTVQTIEDRTVRYSTIWQRRNLVLIILPAADSASLGAYVSQCSTQMPAFRAHDTECVITRDVVAGIASPTVVIADRWGEVIQVATGSGVVELPGPPELLEWVAYLQSRCPECEGEAL